MVKSKSYMRRLAHQAPHLVIEENERLRSELDKAATENKRLRSEIDAMREKLAEERTEADLGTGRVLVRGFEDRPAALRARERGSKIEVFGDDPKRAIGYPVRLVYRFDSDLFQLLSKAYDAGRLDELERHWSRAIPLKP